MNDREWVALIALTATVGSAFISSATTLAVQFFFEPRKQEEQARKEAKRKKEEKLEELVGALYEHNNWFIPVASIELSDYVIATEPVSAYGKLSAISDVYFPEFAKEFDNLRVSTRNYEKWLRN